ncbi:MAG: sulfatase-like hydrolase/transferase [Bacteroidota bacterium]
MPKTHSFQTIAVVLLLATCKPVPDERTISRPNIVFFLVDDLGKEWISAYGAEGIETPNVDALATSGSLFNNVYAMPQCTPTRVTLLTGQYPFRHGWVNHWDVPRWGGGAHFDESVNPSLGRAMSNAGYATCIAGKWQIDDFRVEPDALSRNGFDDYCMWTGYETGIPASANRYQDPYLYTKEGAKTYEGEFGPDVLTDFIIDFIENQKNQQPFFVYYPMVLTHPPLVDTPDEQADTPLGKHKAMVRYADKLTGKVIQALEHNGLRDNTLIIWTTDNGTSRGLEGLRNGRKVEGAKSQTVEPGICVPFIASWPAQMAAKQVSEALIDFSDIFPTFLELAGVDVGHSWKVNGTQYTIDGRSFKDVLNGKQASSPRDWIMSMGGGNHARLTEGGVENQFYFRDRVIRSERYKLCIDTARLPAKFIDLDLDSTESNNLIDSLTNDERREHFERLFQVAERLPPKDNDPRYQPNATREWDVEVTAKSQLWKRGKPGDQSFR